MSFSRGLNSQSTTTSSEVAEALSAINLIKQQITQTATDQTKSQAILEFEDTINPLLGILKLNKEIFPEIQADCLEVKQLVDSTGLTLSLNPDFYPQETVKQTSKLVLGKKLYPRTEMVPVEILDAASQPTIKPSLTSTVAGSTAGSTAEGASQATEESITELNAAIVAESSSNVAQLTVETAVDSAFTTLDELAAAAAASYKDDEALSTIGEESASLIPQGLVDIINANVGDAGSLQENLPALCQNPLGNLITDVRDRILYYTNSNFTILSSTLASVSADSALTSQYKALKESMGGGDGVGGAVAVLNEFLDHTNRLSGLVLEKTNENAGNTSQSTTDNFIYNELPPNVATSIVSFSSDQFRSAKYYIQGSSGIEHQMSEYTVIHDGTYVFGREVDTAYTIDPFISFSSNIANKIITVTANSSIPNTSLVVYGIRLMIAKPITSYTNISQYKIIENHQILNAHDSSNTDYISEQTSGLRQESILASLSEFVQEMFTGMQSGSTAEKQQKLLTAAAAINNFSATLESAMASDYEAYADLSKRAEAMRLAYDWSRGYQDPSVKSLLDKSLNTSVIEQLQ
jgi:hypothetical protein